MNVKKIIAIFMASQAMKAAAQGSNNTGGACQGVDITCKGAFTSSQGAQTTITSPTPVFSSPPSQQQGDKSNLLTTLASAIGSVVGTSIAGFAAYEARKHQKKIRAAFNAILHRNTSSIQDAEALAAMEDALPMSGLASTRRESTPPTETRWEYTQRAPSPPPSYTLQAR
jgi:hypothetical protein